MSNDKERARYSILMAGQPYTVETIEEIGKYLKKGLKVIWFGNAEQAKELSDTYEDYKNARFLCLYISENITTCICDGENIDKDDKVIYELEKEDARFNAKQYLVEHYPSYKELIVEAGAGSGKTHVMVERMMYLMHMCDDFSFSSVAMITFTNKATDNMRHRLTETLNRKYELTRDPKYIDKLEELAQINISTIHVFFKSVLVEIGSMFGYGTNLQLRSYKREKKNILDDLLNNRYGESKQKVQDVIGLPIEKADKLALKYWEKLDDFGLSESEISNLNWGETASEEAQKIQGSLEEIFGNVNEKYNDTKYKDNAISMQDILHELSQVTTKAEFPNYITQKYKYMFIDEFQDSDNVQIQTIAILKKAYNGRLFVVGDIKQSVYRFRGATDSAFTKLKEYFSEEERDALVEATLIKNYRTSKDIMETLDTIFTEWGKLGLLKYNEDAKLVPTVTKSGIYKQIPIFNKDNRKKALITQIQAIYKNQEIQEKEIACLTRNNSELKQIREWCEEKNIVCLIKEKGAFYRSDAVLDFCTLVEAYYYENEPMYLYNYLNSSFYHDQIPVEQFVDCNGEREALMALVVKLIDQEGDATWESDKNDFRNKPVLAVLRRIIEEKHPVKNYGMKRKSTLLQKGYSRDTATRQAIIDTKQYDANLRKLLQILMQQFTGGFSSLGDVCEFLRMKIVIDKEEEVADMMDQIEGACVKGLTVHSAKGLEFDHVLLPFMNNTFYQDYQSEILLSKDHKDIGWIYRAPGGKEKEVVEIKNVNYGTLLEEEKNEVAKEETRLLYVAMTRAVYGLYCFPIRWKSSGERDCWAALLPEEVDNA